jgi:hypothetical protein
MLGATMKRKHSMNHIQNIALVLDTLKIVDTFAKNEKVGTFLSENFKLEIEWKYNILNSCV